MCGYFARLPKILSCFASKNSNAVFVESVPYPYGFNWCKSAVELFCISNSASLNKHFWLILEDWLNCQTQFSWIRPSAASHHMQVSIPNADSSQSSAKIIASVCYAFTPSSTSFYPTRETSEGKGNYSSVIVESRDDLQCSLFWNLKHTYIVFFLSKRFHAWSSPRF